VDEDPQPVTASAASGPMISSRFMAGESNGPA
jgi:hypothetical protein